MAQVIFHPDQPVQALSGSYGEATFRTLPDGRTVVHCHQPDDRAGRAERVISRCVTEIQLHMADMRDAIRQRQAIKRRVARMYGRYCHLTDDDEQLRRWILQAWYNTRRKLPSRGRGQQLATIFNYFYINQKCGGTELGGGIPPKLNTAALTRRDSAEH